MFADNFKISLRQIRRLFILDIFGMGSLMLPGIFSSLTGADGIFCLLLGMAGGFVFLWLMGENIRRMREGYYDYMKDTVGQVTGDIFMVFYLLYFVTLTGYVLYELTALILDWLLPEGFFLWIAVLLLLLAVYGSIRGIEGRARIYEIIFWFLGVPLLLMLLLAAPDVNTAYWTPIVASGPGQLLRGSTAVMIFLLPLGALLFLKPFCTKSEKLASCGTEALLASLILIALVYLILLGVFGQNAMGVLERPVLTLMGMVKLPGGFFTRQDVLMTAVWFFALFALLNTGIFQGMLVLKELCRESKRHYSLYVVAALAFFVGKGLYEHRFLKEIYGIYLSCIALPGMFLILLVLLLFYQLRGGRQMQNISGMPSDGLAGGTGQGTHGGACRYLRKEEVQDVEE